MKATVLIAVADEPLAQRFQHFLRERGYQVATAQDGPECLSKMRTHAPDVLILDLELPWGGGDGVLARMRQHLDTRWLPIVLLTGLTSRATEAELAVPPVVRCLRKPFHLAALLRSVSAASAWSWGRVGLN